MGLETAFAKGFEEAFKSSPGAGVAELADALDSKSGSRMGVWVRAPPPGTQTPLIIPTSKGVGLPTWPWRKKSCGGFPLSGSRRHAEGQRPNSPLQGIANHP